MQTPYHGEVQCTGISALTDSEKESATALAKQARSFCWQFEEGAITDRVSVLYHRA